jgi:hypothetical protein
LPGLPAALWLLGLYAAAPVLRGSREYARVDRLRDALILGVAIPFALGLLHALYPATCWAVLGACLAIALWRHGWQGVALNDSRDPFPYVTLGALVAVAWPQLMRPLLDGDSLSYHLPNAASWVQDHSLWATATRYWWYPPGSELFATGLYAVGSPFSLPWSGFVALALLGFRIAAFARARLAAPALLADALAAATITAYPLAIQGGTLQNDVWLAAFWLETIAALGAPGASGAAMRSVALTVLIKPQGWILTAIAMIAGRARREVWLAATASLGVWILRDALLWSGATLSPSSTAYGNPFTTAIAAHGIGAFLLLVRVGLAISPFALAALAAALFAPVITRGQRALGWNALAATALFFILPFGYDTSVAQLATGESLRFAAPAVVAGALVLGTLAPGFWYAATVVCYASAMYGIVYVLAIFWNDGSTHAAAPVALAAVAVAVIARNRLAPWIEAAAFGLAVVAATHFAARHPVDYYADSLRVGNTTSGIYRWIADGRPLRVGAWGLRLGVVNVLSPSTHTFDLTDAAACAAARRDRVLLVAVAQSDLSPEVNARRLDAARQCGRIVYEDAITVAAEP